MTFYDHSMNVGAVNPAQGQAIARARQTCIKEGRAYKVVGKWKGGNPFYFDGSRYDVLSIAKSLFMNNAEMVVMTDPQGREINVKEDNS